MERVKMKILLDWEKIRDPRGYWKFEGYDNNKKVKLILNSKKQKVKISSGLLDFLDKEHWHYKLN